MRKIGRKNLTKALHRIDWFGVLTVMAWVGMGFYLWCKFWRII